MSLVGIHETVRWISIITGSYERLLERNSCKGRSKWPKLIVRPMNGTLVFSLLKHGVLNLCLGEFLKYRLILKIHMSILQTQIWKKGRVNSGSRAASRGYFNSPVWMM